MEHNVINADISNSTIGYTHQSSINVNSASNVPSMRSILRTLYTLMATSTLGMCCRDSCSERSGKFKVFGVRCPPWDLWPSCGVSPCK
ncbi:hypothetical protein AAMO2058_000298300 [Amorphochlora amoebiformis]